MSTWYAQWYGGSSYAWGDDESIESFPSLAAAQLEFEDRYLRQSWQHHFEYVNVPPADSYCPAVEDDSEMWLFAVDPTGAGDKYPDRIIKVGSRGGIRLERT